MPSCRHDSRKQVVVVRTIGARFGEIRSLCRKSPRKLCRYILQLVEPMARSSSQNLASKSKGRRRDGRRGAILLRLRAHGGATLSSYRAQTNGNITEKTSGDAATLLPWVQHWPLSSEHAWHAKPSSMVPQAHPSIAARTIPTASA